MAPVGMGRIVAVCGNSMVFGGFAVITNYEMSAVMDTWQIFTPQPAALSPPIRAAHRRTLWRPLGRLPVGFVGCVLYRQRSAFPCCLSDRRRHFGVRHGDVLVVGYPDSCHLGLADLNAAGFPVVGQFEMP